MNENLEQGEVGEPQLDRRTVAGLVKLARELGSSRDLPEMLSLFVDAIVEVAGFTCVAVNLVIDSGDLEIVAVTGPPEVEALMGRISTREAWDRQLAISEQRGAVYLDLGGTKAPDLPGWVSTDMAWFDRHVDKNGSWRPEFALCVPMAGPDGELIGVISLDLPVSGKVPEATELSVLEMLAREAETALLSTRRHPMSDIFGAVFETAGTALCIVDDSGRLVQSNQSFRTTFGDIHDLDTWESAVEEIEGIASVGSGFAQVLQDAEAEVSFVIGAMAQGEPRWFHASLRSVTHSLAPTGRVVCALADITDERRLRQRYQHDAEHDQLTGLLNRRGVAAAAAPLRRGGVVGELLVVLVCDLDDFKLANDRHGHAVGDQVLEQVARRLRSAVPEPIVVGRLGGDEFIVIGHCSSVAEAESLADSVVGCVEEKLADGGLVTISAGLAHDQVDGKVEVVDLMRAADSALFRAKTAGKGRWFSASEDREQDGAGGSGPARALSDGPSRSRVR